MGVNMQKVAYIDFETFCEVDLTKCGADVYSRHPSCEVLMASWVVDDAEEVRQWVPAEGEPMPGDFRQLLQDDSFVLEAWNAPFERSIFENVLGIRTPLSRWRDTMIIAAHCAFPLTLGGASAAIGMPQDKRKSATGKRLIRKFCMPRKPTKAKPWDRETHETAPEDWEEFKAYNRQDVIAERAIAKKLERFHPPEEVWEYWRVAQEINERGMPVNLERVNNAIRTYEILVREALDEMREITGLRNPNSRDQALGWLRERGYRYEDLQKGHVAKGIEEFSKLIDKAEIDTSLDRRELEAAKRVLELRQATSLAAPKKFYALQRAVDPTDGHLRNAFQFFGAARTGRFAGRIFQPQNLPRPHWSFEDPGMQEEIARCVEHLGPDELRAVLGNPFEVLKSSIRQCVEAPRGHVFIGMDYSAVENRGIGWICGDDKILDVFRKGRDPYVDFATYMFNESYEALWHQYKVLKDKSKRTLAKPAVLGCLAGGTKVLTPRGWVRLTDVTRSDMVWNGERWAHHGGVVRRGLREVIEWDGVTLTPDHEVYIDGEWTTWQNENSGYSNRVRSMAASSYRSTSAQPSGRYMRVSPQRRSSQSKRIAGVRAVYDILEVEGTSAFTILTDSGPALVHNCGYMLGPGDVKVNRRTGEEEAYGLLGYAMGMGVKMTREQAEHAVKTFRGTFVDVKRFWYESIDAIKTVIRSGEPQNVGPLRFDMKGPFMRMRLPSGRHLHYFRPKIIMAKTPWGEERPTVSYMGKDMAGRWVRLKTHGGKVLENATQAVCLDLLLNALKRAKEEGLDVRLHVHDEIVVMSREDRSDDDMEILRQIMSEVPDWASGFPIGASGGKMKMFMKD